jgi:hypothetical protein
MRFQSALGIAVAKPALTPVCSAKALHQQRPNADGDASGRFATRPVLRTRPVTRLVPTQKRANQPVSERPGDTQSISRWFCCASWPLRRSATSERGSPVASGAIDNFVGKRSTAPNRTEDFDFDERLEIIFQSVI